MLRVLRDKALLSLALLVATGAALGYGNKASVRAGRSFPVQEVARAVVLPFNVLSSGLFALFERGFLAIRPRSLILHENAQLRQRVKDLTAENAVLREAAFENVELRKALGLKDSTPAQMIGAEVISRRESGWFDTATLNKGRNAGVQLGSAVVNHYGLVGQVTIANAFSSQVVALTNPTSSVGAMVQRSRSAGIVQGQGSDTLLLNYLARDADVKIGDIVISSGQGRMIPKGFVIGRVTSVFPSSVTGTASAAVKPSARFDQLEYVFIVKPGDSQP